MDGYTEQGKEISQFYFCILSQCSVVVKNFLPLNRVVALVVPGEGFRAGRLGWGALRCVGTPFLPPFL